MRLHRSSEDYREEVHEVSPKAERAQRAAEMLDHLRVYATDGGGHLVDHYSEGGKKPYEQYGFTPGDGAALLLHIVKHGHVELPAALQDHLELQAGKESEGDDNERTQN